MYPVGYIIFNVVFLRFASGHKKKFLKNTQTQNHSRAFWKYHKRGYNRQYYKIKHKDIDILKKMSYLCVLVKKSCKKKSRSNMWLL